MKTIILAIICIIALLWVGDLTITFKPFSISLPGWHKALGIILFVFAMAVYTIGEYTKGYKQGFDDGIKECVEILKEEKFMSKLYKVTIFGESFLIGWFPFSSRWYNKLKIIK